MVNLEHKLKNTNLNFVIAIDGPSGVGKSTLSYMLARRLNLEYCKSSIFYRYLAFLCIKKHVEIQNYLQILEIMQSSDMRQVHYSADLDIESVGAVASKIAVIPEVREYISSILRNIILTSKRIVIEGRDIGTFIAPNADLKLFLTANIEIRAERRYKQLHNSRKDSILFSEILEQLQARDKRDQERATAPLLPAQDALILDTSHLSIDDLVNKIENLIYQR